MIQRTQRGRLKIYLGYCAGVGKTYQMLMEAHRLKRDGVDVVVGYVETHGRVETEKLVEGLEVVPRRGQEYRGIRVEEMDLDAIIARKPTVALVDELAHTNVPGSANAKRYEDVLDLLAAGIHVISTLNVQHLESLYDTVEQATRVKVRERLPDSVLAEADQIVNVDITTEDLQRRLSEGKVYKPERAEAALDNFFTTGNLEQLRELALRELASHLDLRRREPDAVVGAGAPDQVMVCLSSRGPQSERMLRYASRLAGRLNRNWYAVYVQTPDEDPVHIDAQTQRVLADTLTLAKQLGAMVFTYKGEDIVKTVLEFAREYRVGHLVIGTPHPVPLWRRVLGSKTIVERLCEESRGLTVVVMDTRTKDDLDDLPLNPARRAIASDAPSALAESAKIGGPRLSGMLSLARILVFDHPVTRERALERLAEAASVGLDGMSAETVFEAVLAREDQGSTFFNEGVGFPHARLSGLTQPVIAIARTSGGIEDIDTERPIELVFLILSPVSQPAAQTLALALVSRACQDRGFRHAARTATSPVEVLLAVQDYEAGL